MNDLQLFDTCAVSHYVNSPERHLQLVSRFRSAQSRGVARISEMTVFEMRRGLAKLSLRGEGRRKTGIVDRLFSELDRVPLDALVTTDQKLARNLKVVKPSLPVEILD